MEEYIEGPKVFNQGEQWSEKKRIYLNWALNVVTLEMSGSQTIARYN